MPSVPRLAAFKPKLRQICRAKLTVELFPLVPVTAAIVAGCAP